MWWVQWILLRIAWARARTVCWHNLNIVLRGVFVGSADERMEYSMSKNIFLNRWSDRYANLVSSDTELVPGFPLTVICNSPVGIQANWFWDVDGISKLQWRKSDVLSMTERRHHWCSETYPCCDLHPIRRYFDAVNYDHCSNRIYQGSPNAFQCRLDTADADHPVAMSTVHK